MARKKLGAVPEGPEVMWHYPAVLREWMGFGRKVEEWDRLDRNLESFAHVAAAGVIGCTFCLDEAKVRGRCRARGARPRSRPPSEQ